MIPQHTTSMLRDTNFEAFMKRAYWFRAGPNAKRPGASGRAIRFLEAAALRPLEAGSALEGSVKLAGYRSGSRMLT